MTCNHQPYFNHDFSRSKDQMPIFNHGFSLLPKRYKSWIKFDDGESQGLRTLLTSRGGAVPKISMTLLVQFHHFFFIPSPHPTHPTKKKKKSHHKNLYMLGQNVKTTCLLSTVIALCLLSLFLLQLCAY